MTTPSGTISLADVNTELGLASTTTISMNQTNVRTLAGVPSGQISMSNLQGKSNRVSISYTFSSNTANASLNLNTISGYSSGKSDITLTINSGVYLYATSTGNAGLTLTGTASGDTLTIVNNGYIMGCGGNACANSPSNVAYVNTQGLPGSAYAGGPGGPALNVSGLTITSMTINNTAATGYIAGGGGAGGSCVNFGQPTYGGSGGGGAGGGIGAGVYIDMFRASPSSPGGGIGASGSPGSAYSAGGGGGRILPGTGGGGGGYVAGGSSPGSGGGAGGGSGNSAGNKGSSYGGPGGSGNSAGQGGSGSAFAQSVDWGGGGGGWGASGNTGSQNLGGGSGGKAVNTGGKSITWTSGNTTRVYGSVS